MVRHRRGGIWSNYLASPDPLLYYSDAAPDTIDAEVDVILSNNPECTLEHWELGCMRTKESAQEVLGRVRGRYLGTRVSGRRRLLNSGLGLASHEFGLATTR